MEKVLAWLLTLVISMFNNVEYVEEEDLKLYTSDYFRIDSDMVMDYRTMSQVAKPSLDSSVACRPYNQSCPTRTKMNFNNTVYWFAGSSSIATYDSIPDGTSYTFESSGYIVAPCDIINYTASYVVSGTWPSMHLECSVGATTYNVDITGMECWYCDLQRTIPRVDDNDPTSMPALTHTTHEDSHRFFAGQILGRASEGNTTISVSIKGSNSTDITLKDFYNAIGGGHT